MQQKLEQLQLSVERECKKRKVNELEKSIEDLRVELRSLEVPKPTPSGISSSPVIMTHPQEGSERHPQRFPSPVGALHDTRSVSSPHAQHHGNEETRHSVESHPTRRSLFTDHDRGALLRKSGICFLPVRYLFSSLSLLCGYFYIRKKAAITIFLFSLQCLKSFPVEFDCVEEG